MSIDLERVAVVVDILDRLKELSTDGGTGIRRSLGEYKQDIESSLDKGWTSNEIVSVLKLTEGVTPELDEEVAMERMAKITERVNKRLKGE